MQQMQQATSTRALLPASKRLQFSWSVDGYLIAVALVATICLSWTVWLVLLTVAPNDTINRLMDTGTFDDGTFWRFIDPPFSALLLGLSGLSCVGIAYLYIIVRVTIFRYRKFSGWSRLLTFQQPKPNDMITLNGAPPITRGSFQTERHTQVAPTELGVWTKSSKMMKAKRAYLVSLYLKR